MEMFSSLSCAKRFTEINSKKINNVNLLFIIIVMGVLEFSCKWYFIIELGFRVNCLTGELACNKYINLNHIKKLSGKIQ
jgi:hypothetical protein